MGIHSFGPGSFRVDGKDLGNRKTTYKKLRDMLKGLVIVSCNTNQKLQQFMQLVQPSYNSDYVTTTKTNKKTKEVISTKTVCTGMSFTPYKLNAGDVKK